MTTAPTASPPPPGAGLGSDSLTWRRFGDLRTLLVVGWAGALQVMHPTISQALVDHSDVFADPLGRLRRSAGPILDVVYGPPAAGVVVRHRHDDLAGTHAGGDPYHALDPAAFTWAHATFVAMQYAVAERFGEPLTPADRERLYAESLAWFARYGVSTRLLPADYEAFCAYWDSTVRDVLTLTEAARRLLLTPERPLPPVHPLVPAPVWTLIEPAFTSASLWLMRGLLPRDARTSLGWRWTAADEVALTTLALVVRLTFRAVPVRWRLSPGARRARRRGGHRFTG